MKLLRNFTRAASITVLLAAGGCSLAPNYVTPAVGVPPGFKEASPSSDAPVASAAGMGAWKAAEPADGAARGAWWTIFGEAKLNSLEDAAQAANPGLAAAAARVKQSRAVQQAASASLFPSLDAGFGPTRQKFSPASQFLSDDANGPFQTFWRAQVGASYEADLFGRVSDSVAASKADAQQSEALYRSVLLALQADVAQQYFTLRELDAELAVFDRTIALAGSSGSAARTGCPRRRGTRRALAGDSWPRSRRRLHARLPGDPRAFRHRTAATSARRRRSARARRSGCSSGTGRRANPIRSRP